MSEKIMIVCKKKSTIYPAGWAWRSCIHNYPRIPHASVLIIPINKETGNVIMHKRSKMKDVSPGCWDFYGGHVKYLDYITTPDLLEIHIKNEALREAKEEIGNNNFELKRITDIGEVFIDSEKNLEFATIFLAILDIKNSIKIKDDCNGKMEEAKSILSAPYRDFWKKYINKTLEIAESANAIFEYFNPDKFENKLKL